MELDEAGEDAEDLSEDTDGEDGDYEVEKVVEHNNLGSEGIEYRMRFKGYTAKDDYWFHESNCKDCLEIINRYWMEKAMAISGGITTQEQTKLFLPVGTRHSEPG